MHEVLFYSEYVTLEKKPTHQTNKKATTNLRVARAAHYKSQVAL